MAKSLDEVHSKEDLTLQDVYALGLDMIRKTSNRSGSGKRRGCAKEKEPMRSEVNRFGTSECRHSADPQPQCHEVYAERQGD